MMSRCYMIFAVPRESIDELAAFYRRWSNALAKLQDDEQVLLNQLYRRADAVALARVTLADDALHGGFLAVSGYVSRKVSDVIDKPVLTPEDCRELSQALAALRERVPDEAVLVRRMFRYKFGDVKPHHVREGWHVLCQALAQAIALEAGLLWASYEHGAEEKLEQKRRDDEAQREAFAREPELSPEEHERKLRELQDEIRRMKERDFQMAMAAEREQDLMRARTTRRTLYVVPAEHLAELRRPGSKPRARAAPAKVQAFDALVAERALAHARFDDPGERGALEVLLGVLRIRTYPRGRRRSSAAVDFYQPAKVATLERELIEWAESLRGMNEPVDTVSLLAHDVETALCDNAYSGLRALLTRAREHSAGLIVITFIDA
jgi:hypothetical protein